MLCILSFSFQASQCNVARRYDKNGDGVLSFDEFGEVLRAHGASVTHEEAKRFFSDIDSDGDKRIDYKVCAPE